MDLLLIINFYIIYCKDNFSLRSTNEVASILITKSKKLQ